MLLFELSEVRERALREFGVRRRRRGRGPGWLDRLLGLLGGLARRAERSRFGPNPSG